MSADYTKADYRVMARKALRYTSLYGVSRTLVKIRGQYHMKAAADFGGTRWVNARCRIPTASERSVALIGCGNYAFSTIAYYLQKHNRRFLCFTYDRHLSRAISLCKTYGGAAAVADWQEILADPQVKLVFVASNHASHADYAVACIEAGKHVHIEKPHVVSQEQLERLTAAMRRHPEVKVFLGFNRPRSRLFKELQAALAAQSGALMINWFVWGHEIPEGHWYKNAGEGGVCSAIYVTGRTRHFSSFQRREPSPARLFRLPTSRPPRMLSYLSFSPTAHAQPSLSARRDIASKECVRRSMSTGVTRSVTSQISRHLSWT